jgi:hypothetical protein
MTVLAAHVELRLDGSFSLKDKRQVLQALLQRSRRQFQVSLAEVGDHHLWNSAEVGVAIVSNSHVLAESQLQALLQRWDSQCEIEIVSVRQEVIVID